jgi:hypothetical protein
MQGSVTKNGQAHHLFLVENEWVLKHVRLAAKLPSVIMNNIKKGNSNLRQIPEKRDTVGWFKIRIVVPVFDTRHHRCSGIQMSIFYATYNTMCQSNPQESRNRFCAEKF